MQELFVVFDCVAKHLNELTLLLFCAAAVTQVVEADVDHLQTLALANDLQQSLHRFGPKLVPAQVEVLQLLRVFDHLHEIWDRAGNCLGGWFTQAHFDETQCFDVVV